MTTLQSTMRGLAYTVVGTTCLLRITALLMPSLDHALLAQIIAGSDTLAVFALGYYFGSSPKRDTKPENNDAT